MTTATTETVPLARLIEDLTIYPRHVVDNQHVDHLADALRSGETFPPIIADRASFRIVDGFHRARAYRRVFHDNAAVAVDLRDYQDERELILNAISLNAGHGKPLSRLDRRHAVALADHAGATNVQVSVALHVPERTVHLLRVQRAQAPSSMDGTVPGTRIVILKRSDAHLVGRELTAEQVTAHQSMPGTSFLLLIHQLREGIRNGLLDLEDGNLTSALRELKEDIEGVV